MRKVTQIPFPQYPSKEQIISIHDDFVLEICNSNASKYLAFNIRYQAYIEAGMTKEKDQKLLYDEYDFHPNSRIFLVWHKKKAVATVRSCIYSDTYDWAVTEGVLNFGQELTDRFGIRTRLLESNRFAVVPQFQGRQSLFARFLLFRAHGLNAAAHQCGYIMTAVQANHIAFYQRFLCLDPISDTPHYYDWLDADVSLLINQKEKCLGAILKRGMPDYGPEDIRRFTETAFVPVRSFLQKVA